MFKTIIAAACAATLSGVALAEGYDPVQEAGWAPAGYNDYGRPNDYAGDAYRAHIHGGERYIAHCRDVVNDRYTHNGRPALFGGIQCGDDYGCSWILKDTRDFIRYLDHGRHQSGYSHRSGHRHDRYCRD